MIPKTVGRKYDVGKVARIQCVKKDTLKDLKIKGDCFLLLIIHEGSAQFQIGDTVFDAIGPCFVCFDERENPKLVKKRGLKCDAIYFHPTFLNVNMTFERVHSDYYEQLALDHDMFLLKPFTDERKYVFSLFSEYIDTVDRLFSGLDNELIKQHDWYWSCRSRSFFIEMILILERVYGLIELDEPDAAVNRIKSPQLKSAVLFIEGHYQDNIALVDITQAASINHSTLTQLFKSELAVTPVEYLWQYRITVAKKFLEFTNLSVKEISIRCGFKTVQHFSRKFEEYTNHTPTDFREQAVAKRKAVL